MTENEVRDKLNEVAAALGWSTNPNVDLKTIFDEFIIAIKHTALDLEATRREREYLKRMIDQISRKDDEEV